MEISFECVNVEELNKNEGQNYERLEVYTYNADNDEIMSHFNYICCRAPLAGVGEDWVEIVIPHQVSSSASNLTCI